MVTVVCWRWGTKYGPGHVARLQGMLRRRLTLPHELVCITDKPNELPPGVRPAPLPKPLAIDGKCLRRLWIYSDAAGALGDRLLQIDLDVVLTDSITPLVDRPEPFVIWRSDSNYRDKWAYNPTLLLLTAGARADIWDRFRRNPRQVWDAAFYDGWRPEVNSDQAIMSYLLKDEVVPIWTDRDGLHAYRVFAGKYGDQGATLPPGCRLVSFHGPRDPGVAELQRKSPWIAEHWH